MGQYGYGNICVEEYSVTSRGDRKDEKGNLESFDRFKFGRPVGTAEGEQRYACRVYCIVIVLVVAAVDLEVRLGLLL